MTGKNMETNALKLVMFVVNEFPVAATGDAWASKEATEPDWTPHGFKIFGLVTSDLAGVPVTPRAGLMIA